MRINFAKQHAQKMACDALEINAHRIILGIRYNVIVPHFVNAQELRSDGQKNSPGVHTSGVVAVS